MYTNRKKMFLWLGIVTAALVLVVYLAISIVSGSFTAFFGNLFHKENPEDSEEEVSFDDSVPRFPGLDVSFNHHYFLQDREQGGCRRLSGNVTVSFVFLDDAKTVWTDAERETFKTNSKAATGMLERQARKYGAGLHITEEYVNAKIDGMVILTDYTSWAEDAFASAGFDKKVFENVGDDAEHPVFFCLNRSGRSLAIPETGKKWEYGVLYRNEPDYRHELLHLFGAQDYYLTETVVDACLAYFPNSVMFSADREAVDPLTAYLVGWTDEVNPEAKAFLDDTAKITQFDIDKAKREDHVTGYGTIPYGDGTYTGYLQNGVPYREGKVVFEGGATYEGEFKDGLFDGYGIYTWVDGYIYEGEWKNGDMNGQGKLRYPGGYVRSGEWKNGEFVG